MRQTGGDAGLGDIAGRERRIGCWPIARGTIHGGIGNASAPELWMFIDPQCSFSVRAMQQLTPFIAPGRSG